MNSASTTESAFDAYIRKSKAAPMLGQEEEMELARRWKDSQDPKAMSRLVESHMRLVAMFARRYSNYGIEPMDLVSAGNEGLIHAVEKFDAEKGNRLSTFAVWHIRAAMTAHVLQFRDVIRIGTTSAQKKVFFNLARSNAKFGNIGHGVSDETIRLIAEDLAVPERTVREVSARMTRAFSIDVSNDEEKSWGDILPSLGPDAEEQLGEREETERRRNLLLKALETLNPREKSIFERIHMSEKPPRMREIAVEEGVSHQRIHQIAAAAYRKVEANIAVMARLGTAAPSPGH